MPGLSSRRLTKRSAAMMLPFLPLSLTNTMLPPLLLFPNLLNGIYSSPSTTSLYIRRRDVVTATPTLAAYTARFVFQRRRPPPSDPSPTLPTRPACGRGQLIPTLTHNLSNTFRRSSSHRPRPLAQLSTLRHLQWLVLVQHNREGSDSQELPQAANVQEVCAEHASCEETLPYFQSHRLRRGQAYP